ncbi:DUF421 domain-containing protein [Bacillus luteolus]|uniref:DUF421 domain-containing protein n=1 Tax=Litchfieldia luteola TaxID=682179 RepID=A0ABR9QLQ4_9BACI|nr:DUF421 domain-containing protein [Cytobacillus luteolus]MBE4909438.1 DUF421 domain-containing protein [Cytobacillus luteolus]MBP1940838.1 uncharacterized membrane protein YcaP (DUF421 family) [Cytobacillus luteolus]
MSEWVEVVIRSFGILIGLFLITKLLGKKQLSKLSFFEYIAGITIGNIAGTLSMDLRLNMANGISSILVWLLFPLVLSLLSLKSKTVRDFVEGKSTVFIKNGKIMEDNLKKEQYSADELLEQLRRKNIFRVADVEFALLEPTGEITALLKREKQPLTVGDIIKNSASIKEPQTVMMDGSILDEPLSTIGLNRGWLKEELDKIGVTPENVFLAQVDSFGQLTVDLYDDKVQVPPPVTLKLLQASIKKCEADFELFALQTESQAAKEMYMKNAEKIREIENKVKPYLEG